MSYHKFTIITGYDTDEQNPFGAKSLGRTPAGDEMNSCSAWIDAHYKSASLNGHWRPESAWKYANRRGWKRVSMTHVVSDMSGHGRGGRTEYSFGPDGTAICTADEDVDDSADIHDLYDEIEGRA